MNHISRTLRDTPAWTGTTLFEIFKEYPGTVSPFISTDGMLAEVRQCGIDGGMVAIDLVPGEASKGQGTRPRAKTLILAPLNRHWIEVLLQDLKPKAKAGLLDGLAGLSLIAFDAGQLLAEFGVPAAWSKRILCLRTFDRILSN